MGREILIDGERTELTKEAILSLKGMQLVEFFLRAEEEPSILLVLSPRDEALVLELEKHIERNESFSVDESKKVYQVVFSVAQEESLEAWFNGLTGMSDNEVHGWCENFIKNEGLPTRDQSSRYNFYTDIQMFISGVIEGISEERDRRLSGRGV